LRSRSSAEPPHLHFPVARRKRRARASEGRFPKRGPRKRRPKCFPAPAARAPRWSSPGAAPHRGERPGKRQPFSERGLAWPGGPPPGGKGGLPARKEQKSTLFSFVHPHMRVRLCMCAFQGHSAPQTLIPEILRRRGAFRPGIQRSSLRPKVEIQIFCRTSKFRFSGCATEVASPSFGGSFPEEGTTQTTAKVFFPLRWPERRAGPATEPPPIEGSGQAGGSPSVNGAWPGQAGHLLWGRDVEYTYHNKASTLN